MDDPDIDARNPSGVEIVVVHEQLGADIDEEAPAVGEKGHSSYGLGIVGNIATKADPQVRVSLGDRQSESAAFQGERRPTKAYGPQSSLAAGIASRLSGALPAIGLEARS
jgi:hypothetical protein